jgi:2-polyprenyl-3-methyl-5-hydroxy-6-metoxy-1,4-benzoquinol methylase
MRGVDCPNCPLCSAAGHRSYHALRDRLFSAPGKWNLNQCTNSACGILWLDPMPLEDDLGEAYADYFTHESSEPVGISRRGASYLRVVYGYFRSPDTPISWKDRYSAGVFFLRFEQRSWLEALIYFLPRPNDEARFLDVGCGNGSSLELLSRLGWNVEGVETDQAAADRARARRLEVHLGTLAEQHFPADSFDAIGLSHVIEHVPRPVELLAECNRILKPGGTMVVLTPNARSLGHKFYGSNWRGLEPPRHLQIFTAPALTQAAYSAGFRKIKAFTTMRMAQFIALASPSIRQTTRVTMTGYGKRQLRMAKLFQTIELLALQFNGQLGEEIVLRTQKN